MYKTKRYDPSIVDVFHTYYDKFTDDEKKFIKSAVFTEINAEFKKLYTKKDEYVISLKDALKWVGNEKETNKQFQKYKDHFKARFLVSNKLFTKAEWRGDSGKMYLEKIDGRTKHIYFSLKGLEYWAMHQTTEKAQLIQSYFSLLIDSHYKNNITKNDELNSDLNDMSDIIRQFDDFGKDLLDLHPKLKKLKEKYKIERPGKGHIYFIYEEDSLEYFKIGYTTNTIEERLSNLQVGSLRTLKLYGKISCDEPKKLENYIHGLFELNHVRGEWYKINSSSVDVIIDLMNRQNGLSDFISKI